MIVTVELDRLDLLRQVFPSLSTTEIAGIDAVAVQRHYTAGTYICREGEQASVFYILAEGEVEVTGGGELLDQDVLLHRSKAPYYFGEIALLGDGRRSASILALQDCITLEIDKQTFQQLANSNPGLRQVLFRQLSGYMRDNDRALIHQLHRQNAELQAAYAHLAEQDRMRTEFISTLAHELRTPLTAIQGFLHLMEKGVISGRALTDGMEVIGRNTEKMVWLVNNLLILYEMQLITPRLTWVWPEKLVGAAVAENRPEAEKKQIEVDVSYAPGLSRLCVDQPAVTLALRLLLDNAVKFSEAGRPVRVHVFAANEEMVCIEVMDQGRGIPQEAQDRIFEPFFRWSQESREQLHAGLGIGLSIANYLITRHQGRIELDSAPGRGSTFRVLLPLVSQVTPGT